MTRRVEPANINPEAGLPLFEALKVTVDPDMPPDNIHFKQGDRIVLKVVNIAACSAARDAGAAAALDAEARKHEIAWAIKKAARSFPEFTSDEVRDILAEIGVKELEHPNALSAAILAVAREGIIEEVNKAPRRSTRPEARRRKLTIWRRKVEDRP